MISGSESKRLLQRIGAVGGLRVVSGGLSFASTVILARLLGIEGFGVYAFCIAWASVVAEPLMEGLGKLLLRAVAQYNLAEEWGLMRGVMRRLNQIVLGISLVAGGIGVAVAVSWLDSSLRVSFALAMLLIPLIGLTFLREAVMQGLGQVVLGQLPEFVIRPVALLAGLGILTWIGDRPSSSLAVAVTVTAVAVGYVVGATQLRRRLPAGVRNAAARYETRRWLRASLPMVMIGAAWSINTYVGILVVGSLGGADQAGLFSVIQKGMSIVAMVLLAANVALSPEIVKLYQLDDRRALEKMIERMARVVFLATLPMAAALALFPQVYLDIFGSDFSGGGLATTILAVGQLFNAGAGPAGTMLLMTNQEVPALAGVAAGLTMNLLLGVLLVPHFGVTGAAVAATASTVLWNLVLVVVARRRLNVNTTAVPALARSGGREATVL